MKQRGIIFDWRGTLVERNGQVIQGATETLELLQGAYHLSLISLSSHPEQRYEQIKASGLHDYFRPLVVARTKIPAQYQECMERMETTPENTWVVDDRTLRGIKIGNELGCKTIWIQRGEYAHEVPNSETGNPTKTIDDIRNLFGILLH